MPDLSNLLGAVYGDSPSSTPRDAEDEAHVEHEPAAEERTPAVPEWADDDHLDAAFAQWKPGPSDDASPAEHAFVKDTDPDDPPPPLADDLAAALSEALVASSGTTHDPDAADVADADAYGGPKPKAYDFSPVDDDVEPLAEIQPVHEVEEHVDEVEAPEELPAVPELASVPNDAAVPDDAAVPNDNVAPEITAVPDVDDVEDTEVEDHQEADVDDNEVDDYEDEPEGDDTAVDNYNDEPHAEVETADTASEIDDDDDHLRHVASITPQRAAAAELTAASRAESDDSVFAPPPPEPQPVPVATAPSPVVAAVPAPEASPAPLTAPMATLPAADHRWERSDDDILPEKQAKKFFNLSLRRG